jgi:hypothetical protein
MGIAPPSFYSAFESKDGTFQEGHPTLHNEVSRFYGGCGAGKRHLYRTVARAMQAWPLEETALLSIKS